MTTAQQLDDPFAGAEKRPAVSFKNKPVGTTYTCIVQSEPKLVHSKDFNTGELAYWPGKGGQQGNPKMSVVIDVEVDGEEKGLWAARPSALFVAIAQAQKEVGKKIEVGGTIMVKFTGEEPHTDPEKIRKDLPPKKLYAVKYVPPAPAPAADPFGSDDAPF